MATSTSPEVSSSDSPEILSLSDPATQSTPASTIVIVVSIIVSILLLTTIFISLYIRRRRAARLLTKHYTLRSNMPLPLQQVSKLDFLPPEPAAPPPYSKDDKFRSEKGIDVDGEGPATPPKVFPKPMVRTRASEDAGSGNYGDGAGGRNYAGRGDGMV